MQRVLPLIVLTLSWTATAALAQDEATLKHAFEGRHVAVLLDMPATHRGVDLRPQHEPEMDYAEYARRVKQYGIALRNGDSVMVTLVKVNKKNIELHLGGGGYGTWGDDAGSVYLPAVTKSSREKQLERDVKRETDGERRRRMERELSRLRSERARDERDRTQRQQALSEIKKGEIAVRRLDGGSRFNVWYDDERLKQWAPTPEELMLAVSRYVNFIDDDGAGAPGMDVTGGDETSGSLRRGMTADDVHAQLGTPSRRRTSTQGELETVVETWESVDQVTEVTFVGGVVVKFTTASR